MGLKRRFFWRRKMLGGFGRLGHAHFQVILGIAERFVDEHIGIPLESAILLQQALQTMHRVHSDYSESPGLPSGSRVRPPVCNTVSMSVAGTRRRRLSSV